MNGADCSVGNNPLAQVSKHAQQDRSLQQGSQGRSNGFSAGSPSSQQFKSSQKNMSDVNRFHMNNFMGEANGMPAGQYSMRMGQSPISNIAGNNWSRGFAPSTQDITPSNSHEMTRNPNSWSQEFYQMPESPSSNTSQTLSQSHSTQHQQNHLPYNTHMLSGPRMMLRPTTGAMPGVLQHRQDESAITNWDEQFRELEQEVADNLNLNAAKDSKDDIAAMEMEGQEEIVIKDDYQSEFQEVWDNLQRDADDLLPDELAGDDAWEADYQRFLSGRVSGNMKYKFDDENEYLHNPNAYEIGCILMENGAKLSEAALAFEAAVQEDPKHVDAWLKLGEVQTQNEKELHGISALEQCLKLDQSNLEAMKTLAISYINEGYDVSAFTMLNRWVETKYPNLLDSKEGITIEDDFEHEQERYKLNEKIKKQFLQIANRLPQVDPDVQLCLGLLFYADDEFDKTIDCFKAALNVNPQDELMWNRLGASLANSNRSEEAIQAYHKALQLKPSFVRARYNLAVSCINIGCYKEAAEHLLASLKMHEVEGVQATPTSRPGNNNILETLKRAFVALDRRDLLDRVKPGMDLDQFRGEFKF